MLRSLIKCYDFCFNLVCIMSRKCFKTTLIHFVYVKKVTGMFILNIIYIFLNTYFLSVNCVNILSINNCKTIDALNCETKFFLLKSKFITSLCFETISFFKMSKTWKETSVWNYPSAIVEKLSFTYYIK